FFLALSALIAYSAYYQLAYSTIASRSISEVLTFAFISLSFSLAIVSLATVLLIHHFYYRRRIIVAETGIILPRTFWSGKAVIVPFSELKAASIEYSYWTLSQTLVLRDSARVYNISESCLDMGTFSAVVELVNKRWQAPPEETSEAPLSDPGQPNDAI